QGRTRRKRHKTIPYPQARKHQGGIQLPINTTIMNSNQTVEKLRQMRLGAMAELHGRNVKDNRLPGVTTQEKIALRDDHEWADMQGKKIARFTHRAWLEHKAAVADTDHRDSRKLHKNIPGTSAPLVFIN